VALPDPAGTEAERGVEGARLTRVGGSVDLDQLESVRLAGLAYLVARLRHELRREINADAGRAVALEHAAGKDGTAAGDVEQAAVGGQAKQVDQAIQLVEAGGVAKQVVAMRDVEVAPAVHRTRVGGGRDPRCQPGKRAKGERGDPGETEKARISPALGRKRGHFWGRGGLAQFDFRTLVPIFP